MEILLIITCLPERLCFTNKSLLCKVYSWTPCYAVDDGKKKKKLVFWWNTRTNKNFWFIMRITETLESLGSFRCVTFSILPQKFRIVLEDNEVICSQRTILMGRTFDEVLWWPLQYFPLSWCSDVGLAIGMAAQYSLCCSSFFHALNVYTGKCKTGSISKHKIYGQTDMHVLK